MNRIVDAVPLESEAGRRFGELVNAFIAGGCHDRTSEASLRAQLTVWRDNDARFQSLAQRSFLVKEASTTSQDLSALGALGLAALDFVAKGTAATADWKAQQLALIEQMKKPKGQLLLIPVESLQKLVEAASSAGGCVAKT
jgi:hexosaminidase